MPQRSFQFGKNGFHNRLKSDEFVRYPGATVSTRVSGTGEIPYLIMRPSAPLQDAALEDQGFTDPLGQESSGLAGAG